MFWKNKIKRDKINVAFPKRKKGSIKEKSPHDKSDILIWADRIIEEKGTNEKSRRPGVSRGLKKVIIISTLTVLVALIAHFCTYK